MTQLTLFMFPGACSRVSLIALETAGADYDAVMIDILNGAQRRSHYLEVNPRGKVPALLVDGTLLTENAATARHRRAIETLPSLRRALEREAGAPVPA